MNLPLKFTAKLVSLEDPDDYCWMVAFVDDPDSVNQYLMLQRGYEDDEQDIQLGMNIYYLERDDQGWSCYGGIDHFELFRDFVRIYLNDVGFSALGEIREITIDFKINDYTYRKLKNRLRKIFFGTDCLIEKYQPEKNSHNNKQI